MTLVPMFHSFPHFHTLVPPRKPTWSTMRSRLASLTVRWCSTARRGLMRARMGPACWQVMWLDYRHQQ